ncbi:hypothetical protein HDU96_007361 [Phlyctochytrium bullatum]|nr:hypothetical protein HDU96_007361 [Phlyctochytrium bullatum]
MSSAASTSPETETETLPVLSPLPTKAANDAIPSVSAVKGSAAEPLVTESQDDLPLTALAAAKKPSPSTAAAKSSPVQLQPASIQTASKDIVESNDDIPLSAIATSPRVPIKPRSRGSTTTVNATRVSISTKTTTDAEKPTPAASVSTRASVTTPGLAKLSSAAASPAELESTDDLPLSALKSPKSPRLRSDESGSGEAKSPSGSRRSTLQKDLAIQAISAKGPALAPIPHRKNSNSRSHATATGSEAPSPASPNKPNISSVVTPSLEPSDSHTPLNALFPDSIGQPLPVSPKAADASSPLASNTSLQSSGSTSHGSERSESRHQIFEKAEVGGDPFNEALAATIMHMLQAKLQPWMSQTEQSLRVLTAAVEETEAVMAEIGSKMNLMTLSKFTNHLPKKTPTPHVNPDGGATLLPSVDSRTLADEQSSKVGASLAYRQMQRRKQEEKDEQMNAKKAFDAPEFKDGVGAAGAVGGEAARGGVRKLCVRCEGFGMVHAGSRKKSKSAKVKCTLCDGAGVLINASPCLTCKAYGFIHPSSELETCKMGVRCINCLSCPDCEGLGLIREGPNAFLPTPTSENPASTTTSITTPTSAGVVSYLQPNQPLPSFLAKGGLLAAKLEEQRRVAYGLQNGSSAGHSQGSLVSSSASSSCAASPSPTRKGRAGSIGAGSAVSGSVSSTAASSVDSLKATEAPAGEKRESVEPGAVAIPTEVAAVEEAVAAAPQ